jgi:hypothetical protein
VAEELERRFAQAERGIFDEQPDEAELQRT